jgi:hypothetical protein
MNAMIKPRQPRALYRHAARLALVVTVLLSGGATQNTQDAGGCVGPPSFCNIYFGS